MITKLKRSKSDGLGGFIGVSNTMMLGCRKRVYFNSFHFLILALFFNIFQIQITIPREMHTYPMIFTIFLPMTFYMEGNSCPNRIMNPCSLGYRNSLSNPKDLDLQTHKKITFFSTTYVGHLSLSVSLSLSLSLSPSLPPSLSLSLSLSLFLSLIHVIFGFLATKIVLP